MFLFCSGTEENRRLLVVSNGRRGTVAEERVLDTYRFGGSEDRFDSEDSSIRWDSVSPGCLRGKVNRSLLLRKDRSIVRQRIDNGISWAVGSERTASNK